MWGEAKQCTHTRFLFPFPLQGGEGDSELERGVGSFPSHHAAAGAASLPVPRAAGALSVSGGTHRDHGETPLLLPNLMGCLPFMWKAALSWCAEHAGNGEWGRFVSPLLAWHKLRVPAPQIPALCWLSQLGSECKGIALLNELKASLFVWTVSCL